MADYKEEKLQILKMIEEGKITSEEGVKLLEALEDREDTSYIDVEKAKWIKVKVFEPDKKTNVDVTIPLSIIDVGMKIANKISPDFKKYGLSEEEIIEILNAIKSGASGKIVDVKGENGETVEIVVE
ncbi:MAG: hypothetical protein GXZ06_04875 [Tissierellia bacterium]|nr:hypothetical protein [Tissierellia bacterium]